MKYSKKIDNKKSIHTSEYGNKFFNRLNKICAKIFPEKGLKYRISVYSNDECKDVLFSFLDEIKNKMTDDVFREYKEDISNGDFETAFSLICNFISYYQISISNEFYGRLIKFNERFIRKCFFVNNLERLIDPEFKPIDYQKSIEGVIDLLNEMKSKIDPESVKIIEELAEHHEWGLAFEILYEYLVGNTIPITNNYYEKLVAYNSLIGFSEKRILHLKSLLKLRTLTGIIDQLKAKFSEGALKDIYSCIAIDDWKSAFEMLCLLISETNEITISQKYYDQLVDYAKFVCIPESEIIFLKKQVC